MQMTLYCRQTQGNQWFFFYLMKHQASHDLGVEKDMGKPMIDLLKNRHDCQESKWWSLLQNGTKISSAKKCIAGVSSSENKSRNHIYNVPHLLTVGDFLYYCMCHLNLHWILMMVLFKHNKIKKNIKKAGTS